MSDPRLLWRCRRGMLEVELLLTAFLEREYRTLGGAMREGFERLLELPDNDLWDALSGHRVLEERELQDVVERIRATSPD